MWTDRRLTLVLALLVAACDGRDSATPFAVSNGDATPAPLASATNEPLASPLDTPEPFMLDGRLFFARFDVDLGDMTVWVADADGSGARRLVEGAHYLSCVQRSTVVMAGPDGDGRMVISAAALDGSPFGEADVRPADLNLGVAACAAEPGIVFAEGWVVGAARRTGIYRADFTQGTATQLTKPPAGQHDIPGCVTSDGERIAFIRADVGDNPGTLHTVAIDGSDERRLATDRLFKTGPGCSRDGETLLVEIDGRLYLVDEANGNVSEITSQATGFEKHKYGPWFASEEVIMFSLRHPGPYHDLYAMRLDGTGLTRLTRSPEVDNESPRLVPDP